MKESSFENLDLVSERIPERRSIKEITSEQWREFSETFKGLSNKNRLIALMALGIATGSFVETERGSHTNKPAGPADTEQTEQAVFPAEEAYPQVEFNEAAYEQEMGLDDKEVGAAAKMFTEMPDAFKDMREAALENIKGEKKDFESSRPKEDVPKFRDVFAAETWNGRTIFEEDRASETVLEEEGENLLIRVCSTKYILSDYVDTVRGNMPDDWQQSEKTVEMLSDVNIAISEKSAFKAKGIGKDRNQALARALSNAAAKMGKPDDDGQPPTSSGSIIPTNVEYAYEAAIKEYRVLHTEESNGADRRVTIEIEVLPGKLEKNKSLASSDKNSA